MLNGLADEVSQKAKHVLDWHGNTEGQPADGWIVIDLHDIVVHLFSPDQREYYQLEELWDRGKTLLRLQ
jgi:ribosome-associated protein